MIYSKPSCISGKKCIRYWGTHEELRDMLEEGDLATMLMQNEDNTESIKISGVVKHIGDIGVHMSVCGSSRVFTIEGDCCYTVTSIKRPVENMLPDSPGPWRDKNGDVWIVDGDLHALKVIVKGIWITTGLPVRPFTYKECAPFKKVNIIEEEVFNEQA